MVDGKSETILITTAFFVALSFIAVCLRCFVRLRITKAFGWDDRLMVFAMVSRIYIPIAGMESYHLQSDIWKEVANKQ